MNIYTVSVFGHRKIENFKSVEKLALTIEELIRTKPYGVFYDRRNDEKYGGLLSSGFGGSKPPPYGVIVGGHL